MVGGFMLIQSDFPVPPFPWMVGKKKKSLQLPHLLTSSYLIESLSLIIFIPTI
jgi:hypothetical protein